MKEPKESNVGNENWKCDIKHKKSKKKKKHKESDLEHFAPKYHSSGENVKIKKMKKKLEGNLGADVKAEEGIQNVVGELIIKSEVFDDNSEIFLKSELCGEDQTNLPNCVLFEKRSKSLDSQHSQSTEAIASDVGNIKGGEKKKKKKKTKSDFNILETYSVDSNALSSNDTKKRKVSEAVSIEIKDVSRKAKRKHTASISDSDCCAKRKRKDNHIDFDDVSSITADRNVHGERSKISSFTVTHDTGEKRKKKKKHSNKSCDDGGSMVSVKKTTYVPRPIDENSIDIPKDSVLLVCNDKDDIEGDPFTDQSQGRQSKTSLESEKWNRTVNVGATSEEEDPEITALHEIDALHPQPEFWTRLKERGISWKLGRWSKEELRRLRLNWDHIFEEFSYNGVRYDIMNSKYDVDREKSKRIKDFIRESNFYRRLGRGIKRPLGNIYYKARTVFLDRKETHYTEQEVVTLINLQKELGNNWNTIGERMNRKPSNLRHKWKSLQREVLGKWSVEENKRLVKVVKHIVGVKNVFGRYERLPWTKIAKQIPSRSAKQCRKHWMNGICFSGSEEGAVLFRPFSSQEAVDLIDCIVDDESHQDESDIHWNQIARTFEKVTPVYLQLKWDRIKGMIKNFQTLTFAELVEAVLTGPYCYYLKKAEMEKIQLKAGKGRNLTARLIYPTCKTLPDSSNNLFPKTPEFIEYENLSDSESD